jgi:hypothetical protein
MLLDGQSRAYKLTKTHEELSADTFVDTFIPLPPAHCTLDFWQQSYRV